MSDSSQEQIKQRTFIKASPEKVYDTITSGDEWNKFFTHATEVDARPGGHITFRWQNWGPDSYSNEAGGPVVEADRPRRFVFQWGKNRTTVTFDLKAEFGGTSVTCTENGYSDSPEDVASMLDCASGWGEAVTLLKFYIEHGVVYTSPEK